MADDEGKQAADPYAERKALSFEQAEGAEPLPAQLRLRELSNELRAHLWEAIYRSLKRSYYRGQDGSEFLEPWENIFYRLHVYREHRMVDEFENDFQGLVEKTKETIKNGDYLAVFGWIQYVLRCGPPGDFAGRFKALSKKPGPHTVSSITR